MRASDPLGDGSEINPCGLIARREKRKLTKEGEINDFFCLKPRSNEFAELRTVVFWV